MSQGDQRELSLTLVLYTYGITLFFIIFFIFYFFFFAEAAKLEGGKHETGSQCWPPW